MKVFVPVKEHRNPLHGNDYGLAVRDLWVRVDRATGGAGFLLAWEKTNMTRRDAHRLCYSRARLNLTSNPCHIWTWCKHRWEDHKEVESQGHQLNRWREVRLWSGTPISHDQNLVDLKIKFWGLRSLGSHLPGTTFSKSSSGLNVL